MDYAVFFNLYTPDADFSAVKKNFQLHCLLKYYQIRKPGKYVHTKTGVVEGDTLLSNMKPSNLSLTVFNQDTVGENIPSSMPLFLNSSTPPSLIFFPPKHKINTIYLCRPSTTNK